MSRVPAASLSEVVTMSNATRTVRLVRGVAAMGRGLQLPGRASTNSALAYAFEIELDTCWKCLAMPSNVQNQILSCDANHGARPRRSEHACETGVPSASAERRHTGGAGCIDGCSRVHRCIGSAVGWPSVRRRLVRSARARRAAVCTEAGVVLSWRGRTWGSRRGRGDGAWRRAVWAAARAGSSAVGSVAVRLPSIGSGGMGP